MKNNKYWFENKKCDICGHPGTMFRFIKDKQGILCDSKKCDYITRIKAGFFNELNIKGVN